MVTTSGNISAIAQTRVQELSGGVNAVQIVTTDGGTKTSGNGGVWEANGNLVDSGSPAGGAGSAACGAYSFLPSAGTSGRLYICTDGPYWFYDNSVSWSPFIGGSARAQLTRAGITSTLFAALFATVPGSRLRTTTPTCRGTSALPGDDWIQFGTSQSRTGFLSSPSRIFIGQIANSADGHLQMLSYTD